MIEKQLFPLPASQRGGKSSLSYARKKKRDDFYTRATDIECELPHYAEFLKGKHVFCNCDDAAMSQFWFVLQSKFHAYGLKHLTAICYTALQASCRWDYDGKDITCHDLKGNGDFRSLESVEVLEQCDVVITNPPFSIFREYMAQLVEHKKKFLIIANLNTFMNATLFPHFVSGEFRMGVTARVKGMFFHIPNEYYMENQKPQFDETGRRMAQISTTRWFTNIDHGWKPDGIVPHYKYNERDYPRYTNFDAIEVAKSKRIPMKWSYDGMMGVPITFLDHHRHDQFKLLGVDANVVPDAGFHLPDRAVYRRILIAHAGYDKPVEYYKQQAKEAARPTLI